MSRKTGPLLFLWILLFVMMAGSVFFYKFMSPKQSYGVVTGVIYNLEKPSAIIDGEIVSEGDVLHDVTIVKIHRAMVEFEKDGKRWTQRTGSTPSRAWQEQAQSEQ